MYMGFTDCFLAGNELANFRYVLIRFSIVVLTLAGWGFLSTLTLFKYRNFPPVQALSNNVRVNKYNRYDFRVFQGYVLVAENIIA